MYKDLQRTCTAVVLLRCHSRCRRRRRDLLEFPNISAG